MTDIEITNTTKVPLWRTEDGSGEVVEHDALGMIAYSLDRIADSLDSLVGRGDGAVPVQVKGEIVALSLTEDQLKSAIKHARLTSAQ